jgi:hypothetical protein
MAMRHPALPPDPNRRQVAFLLECLECGRRSETARGWKAYLYEDREVWVYCADCAAREFEDD